MTSLISILVVSSGLLNFATCQYSGSGSNKPGELPTLNVDAATITLSGFSSGGSFAQMMQIAHSAKIYGSAVFSHTFYRCGRPTGKVDDYDRACTKLFNASALYSVDNVHEEIRNYHAQRLIDDPKNLDSKKLYLYTALRNFLFSPDQSLSVIRLFETYIKNPKQIMNRVQDAQLVLPTDNNYGKPCTEPADDTTFIGQCGFSGAHEAISFLLRDKLNFKDEKLNLDPKLASRLKTFDQTPFTKDISEKHHMDNVGFYFVPSSCGSKKQCKLHFYFHGCLNGRQFNGTKHFVNSGYLEVGEQYGIIMVFPQALASLPENEIGCWDTFGISGQNYATKRGAQIIAVNNMINKLTQKKGGSGSGGSGGWSSSGGGYGGGRPRQSSPQHNHNNRRGNRNNEWSF